MRVFVAIIGFLILIAGLDWAAIEAGAPRHYVMIGSVILFGLGVITAASRTRLSNNGVTTVVRDDQVL